MSASREPVHGAKDACARAYGYHIEPEVQLRVDNRLVGRRHLVLQHAREAAERRFRDCGRHTVTGEGLAECTGEKLEEMSARA